MIRIYSENEWIFPDTVIDTELVSAELHAAKGGSVCCQVLTDINVADGDTFEPAIAGAQPIDVICYQLKAATVNLNSAKDRLCTRNYEEVKDFVIRKAPFDIYDVTYKLDDGKLRGGRLALYIRFNVPSDCPTGAKKITVSFFGTAVTVTVNVHNVEVPPLKDAGFGQINWMYIDRMDKNHKLKKGTERRKEILQAYIRDQLDMRNTDFKLPSAVPVRDADGKVIGFDFSDAEFVGNIALEMGMRHVLGGFVARFKEWQLPEHYLLWDRDVSIASVEGYRQLSLYFKAAKASVDRCGWGDKYQQCLVDEPQFPNSEHYRILTAITRKFLPGTIIHDPVESAELYGGTDIWCVKQAVYEKYIDRFRYLQELGEPMWLYTCGFPAGYVMNRVMDLPLTASRLPFWMCIKYNCVGFLHWGYHCVMPDMFGETCYRPNANNPDRIFPAGNAHIVYPGEDGPIDSVRAHLQRMGAEDAELLMLYRKKDPAGCEELIEKLCRSFSDYTRDGNDVDRVRAELLCRLEE